MILLLGIGVFISFFKDLPRPEKFTEGIIPQSTKIYDREGKILLYEIAGEEKRTFVSLEQIPLHLQQAVIATEDQNFYQHRGLDLKAIGRAMLYDLKIRKPAQGASTISQQLIRSYFLTQHKTLKRKTREIILTLELERRYSKEQILEWHLNLIPFGSNLYGAETASVTFFRKPVSEISLAQAATLAALIKAPSTLWPYGPNREKLLARKDYVLDRMVKEHFITETQAKEAKEEKIEFAESLNPIKAPHFVLFLKDYLERKYGKDFLTRAGLKVITTLDIDLQEKAEALIENSLLALKNYNAHNGALVALNPKTGEVLVMIGSSDYFGTSTPKGCTPGLDCHFDPQVNVALMERQPGSAFKPFAYAQALQKGFTPQTTIWDVPTEFDVYCSPTTRQEKNKYGLDCYHPQNYTGTFKGRITLKQALAQSRNLPSVKVLYLAGLKETLGLAKTCGFESLKEERNYGLSLVLGGGEVKLLEMVEGYSVFANDGTKAPLNIIKRIEDAQGNVIEEMKKGKLKILPTQTARQINDILSDNAVRAPMFGWYSPLYIPNYDVAAKTGTTQRYNDAWTIGYTPSLVTGVWVGNNDNSSMTEPGVVVAGPIWHNFMVYALEKLPKEDFQKPKETTTGNPILDGELLPSHSILHYINKNNPLSEGNSQNDAQYPNWEYGVRNFW